MGTLGFGHKVPKKVVPKSGDTESTDHWVPRTPTAGRYTLQKGRMQAEVLCLFDSGGSGPKRAGPTQVKKT